ncbi:hypothetical protein D3C85_1414610 [compost metagenome]
MPGELRQFQQQLASMQARLRLGQVAELAGVETGFSLNLRTLDQGQIIGDWRFQPAPPVGAWITGQCGLDQSFLGELLRGIDALLSFSG